MRRKQTYILCPSGCGRHIPEYLQCGGHATPENKDLWYRICRHCRYYEWVALPPSRAPAMSSFYFPPEDYPRSNPSQNSSFDWLTNWQPGNSGPPSNQLQVSSQNPAFISTTFPPSSTTSPSESKQCMTQGCSHVIRAPKCSRRLCKAHCQKVFAATRISCGSDAHCKEPAALSSSLDPSNTVFTDASFPTNAAKAKAMTPAMREQWDRDHMAREHRRQAEENRRLDRQKVLSKFMICYWASDDQEPEIIGSEGVETFPNVNLSRHPSLLQSLGISSTEKEIRVHHRGVLDMWVKVPIDSVQTLSSKQGMLLIRHVDIKSCYAEDVYVEQAYSQITTSSSSSYRPRQKRKATDDMESALPLSKRHSSFDIDLSHDDDSRPSSSACSSPSISVFSLESPSSSVFSLDSPTLPAQSLPTLPSESANCDELCLCTVIQRSGLPFWHLRS
ncbi:hypothetical protein C8J56DRAFT_1168459 [Mycena floridula]|nr:hypothetical protein C8J56DRAFT_1168459 [Mycena floridula]